MRIPELGTGEFYSLIGKFHISAISGPWHGGQSEWHVIKQPNLPFASQTAEWHFSMDHEAEEADYFSRERVTLIRGRGRTEGRWLRRAVAVP